MTDFECLALLQAVWPTPSICSGGGYSACLMRQQIPHFRKNCHSTVSLAHQTLKPPLVGFIGIYCFKTLLPWNPTIVPFQEWYNPLLPPPHRRLNHAKRCRHYHYPTGLAHHQLLELVFNRPCIIYFLYLCHEAQINPSVGIKLQN